VNEEPGVLELVIIAVVIALFAWLWWDRI